MLDQSKLKECLFSKSESVIQWLLWFCSLMKAQSPIRQDFRVILDFEFGSSTFLIECSDEAPTEVRQLMESETVGAMAWV